MLVAAAPTMSHCGGSDAEWRDAERSMLRMTTRLERV